MISGMIFQLTAHCTYYLCVEPVDMRKSFHTLVGVVENNLQMHVTSDAAYIFIGKSLKTMKVLHKEGNGLTLYLRKLHHGQYTLPAMDHSGAFHLKYEDFILMSLGCKENDFTIKKVPI